ncbi:uncharacterized protein MONOS_11414 [Monocercomonoides exilis]|uniref:uncharacterized protein n=1 Tax=Monocercomonoides exilis TaxID=2049356 RepID=UPI00355A8385|nr:hypothetical protein MONOS_11414 [Monocercomonoides exilis]|eukprot:MONOS_11414.1-p1 / transcript=MONOS_11414.1 / gene=MONOS_11414 / organism=Monocercomonoides_exilis_PA203 / gene_product=unspecified product / transcript_product=unspecified product / location=Mono_scaffold00571:35415-35696(-) / protein_length=94 / sequence_SO=supercontig / SO=protein_coding / is_pseudo=false
MGMIILPRQPEKQFKELALEEVAETVRRARGLEAERRIGNMEGTKEAEVMLKQAELRKKVEEKKGAAWIGEERGREASECKTNEQESTKKQNK